MDLPRPMSTFSDGMGRVADLSETPAPRVPVWPDEHPDTMRLLLRLRRVFPWVLPRHDLLVDHLVYAGFSPAAAQRAAKDARRGQGHEDDHPIPDEQEAVRVGSDIVVDGISLAAASELAAHHEHLAKGDRDDQCPVCQGAPGTASDGGRFRPHDRLAALAKMGVLTDKLRAPRRRERRRAPNRMEREVESWYGDPFKRHGPPSPSHSDRGLTRVASS